MPAFIDRSGVRYGRLVAISRRLDVNKPGRAQWECLCDCGSTVVVDGSALGYGRTKSCGCLQREAVVRMATKHGGCRAGTELASEYRIWQAMLTRCRNKNQASYGNYGGRGIKVCARWVKSFSAFIEDMGPRPSSKHSIDRHPNRNGNYTPRNCRWSTTKEQGRNKRNNLRLRFGGVTRTASEWEEFLGLPHGRISYRLRSGWSLERTITTPLLNKGK